MFNIVSDAYNSVWAKQTPFFFPFMHKTDFLKSSINCLNKPESTKAIRKIPNISLIFDLFPNLEKKTFFDGQKFFCAYN